MPMKGRPRLTPELQRERIEAYCARYGVCLTDKGLPPFPTGQRETAQHREWLSLYKAQDRLGRRTRGQCERCKAPAAPSSVFCEEHRTLDRQHAVASEIGQRLREVQKNRCPICLEKVGLSNGIVDLDPTGSPRGVLHLPCRRLAALAEPLGPDAWDRLRDYLAQPHGPRVNGSG